MYQKNKSSAEQYKEFALPQLTFSFLKLFAVIPVVAAAIIFAISLYFAHFGLLACFALVPGLVFSSTKPKFIFYPIFTFVAALGATSVAFFGIANTWPLAAMGVLISQAVWFVIPGLFLAYVYKLPTAKHKLVWFLPLVWAFTEWLPGQEWIFGGLVNPALKFGTMLAFTPFGGLAAHVGVAGLSVLLILVNVAIAQIFVSKNYFGFLGLSLVMVLLFLLPKNIKQVSSVAVQLVQYSPGSLLTARAIEDEKALAAFLLGYRKLMEADSKQLQPSFSVWPESASQVVFGNKAQENLLKTVLRGSPPVLMGGAAQERKKIYNSILYFNGKDFSNLYKKTKLVPFTETPGFSRGSEIPVTKVRGHSLGLRICGENLFPELSRNNVNAGAELLVYSANISSAGNTILPYLHLRESVLRAIETGRSVAHSSLAGPSAFIKPDGRILLKTKINERIAITAKLPIMIGKTYYVQFGDFLDNLWAMLGCCVFLLLAITRKIPSLK